MDTLITIVLFAGVGYGIYLWLQKRKLPKPFSPALDTIDPDYFAQRVQELVNRHNKANLIEIWSAEIIRTGGTYVPPTLGDGMTKLMIAEEIVALQLGGRP